MEHVVQVIVLNRRRGRDSVCVCLCVWVCVCVCGCGLCGCVSVCVTVHTFVKMVCCLLQDFLVRHCTEVALG